MKKVLLIEDNLEMRENTAEILELSGYQVVTAENGKIGIEKAKQYTPDLIICDIMMPELDGYGVLRVLSKIPITSNIPFIFLTAKTERDDFRKGMALGADDYITKPFDDVELMDAIELRLKKHKAFQKKFEPTVEGVQAFLDEARGQRELDRLSHDRPYTTYKKKEVIYHQADYPHSIFFIAKGKVKTYKINKEGKEYITALFKTGDFFGYMDLMQDSVYSESAMTMEDSQICQIPKDDFFKLITANRDVANRFIKLLSSELMEVEERILRLAYNSVRKRVAEGLIFLKEKFEEENDGEPFSMNIAREDLANIVGTSQESVIRTLSDFKDEHLVEIKGSKVTIVSFPGLVNMRN